MILSNRYRILQRINISLGAGTLRGIKQVQALNSMRDETCNCIDKIEFSSSVLFWKHTTLIVINKFWYGTLYIRDETCNYSDKIEFSSLAPFLKKYTTLAWSCEASSSSTSRLWLFTQSTLHSLCSLHLHCIQPTVFLSHIKPAPTSQQYFSLTKNQHQPAEHSDYCHKKYLPFNNQLHFPLSSRINIVANSVFFLNQWWL